MTKCWQATISFLLTLMIVIWGSAKANEVTTSNIWSTASFPVENFQGYTSPFGYRHSATGGGGWEFHSGLDIAAPEGSYIHNWWGGTVTRVGDRDACGTHIMIESGAWQHTYCHMEGHVEDINGRSCIIDRGGGIQICEGEEIAAGTKIGRVGMTGRTTGPHLHWSLKYNGNYVDPALVLRAMFSQQQVAKLNSQANTEQSQLRIQESNYIHEVGY